jgi:hypothetical protein
VLLLDRARLPKNGALFAEPPRVELAAFGVKLYRNDDPAIVPSVARFVFTPIIKTAYVPTAPNVVGIPVNAVLCVVASLKRISVFLNVVGMIAP